MIILCEYCRNVDEPTRKLEWFRWRCLVSPKPVPVQFVITDPWLTEPPFEKCKDVNRHGDCSLFEPLSEGEPDEHQ